MKRIGSSNAKNKNNTLKELALIDSSLYCAENNLYEDVFNKIRDGVDIIENIDFSPIRELGECGW